MSSQYVMATIEMPLLLHPDGKYEAINDRTKVSFSKIYKLPNIQTKTTIHMSELLSQLGVNRPETETEPAAINENTDADDEGLIFKLSNNSNETKTTPISPKEMHISPTQTDQLSQLSPEHTEMQVSTSPLIYVNELKGRRKAAASKTFKTRPSADAKRYSRKIYDMSHTPPPTPFP